MIASGNHTTIHAGTALAVTERALSAPYGGTSPKGRGKRGYLTNPNFFFLFVFSIIPHFLPFRQWAEKSFHKLCFLHCNPFFQVV